MLHFLGRPLLGYEQRVLGVDGDDVFAIDEHYGFSGVFGVGEVSGFSDFHHVGIYALVIGEFLQGVEASQVGPSYVYSKNAHVIGFFQ